MSLRVCVAILIADVLVFLTAIGFAFYAIANPPSTSWMLASILMGTGCTMTTMFLWMETQNDRST